MYSTPHYFSNNANDNINLHHIERPLLGPSMSGDNGKKCLIIDLDETLVHSSFKVFNALQLYHYKLLRTFEVKDYETHILLSIFKL